MNDNCDIVDATLVLPRKVVAATLEVRDGRIRWIGKKTAARRRSGIETIHARGCYAVPGFIDTHVHGGGGYLPAEEGGLEAMRGMVRAHWAHGTTSLYITAASMRPDQERTFLENFALARHDGDMGDSLPGVHMEGPFLSTAKAGAHAHALLRPARITDLDDWQAWSQDGVRLITVAVEADPEMAFIREATRRGIRVLLGHSDCTYETALSAFRMGANRVTHCFNAVSGLHHRKPGIVGAALSEDEARVELICDGHHVHPAVMRVTGKCKPPGKLIAVTDCLSEHDPAHPYTFIIGGAAIHYDPRGFYALENGTMAGSSLTMDQAVANLQSMACLSLPEAVCCATLNPAMDLGIQRRKGSLERGKDADIVILDKNGTVRRTLVKGRTVYSV
jgi:N-acetylglucosamine-6-phosphate deacetylase